MSVTKLLRRLKTVYIIKTAIAALLTFVLYYGKYMNLCS